MSYTESKQKLDTIRDKYGCTGEVIFRTAIQYVVELGQNTFKDEAWYEDQLNAIDDRHDAAEMVGKFLFMTRDFEKAIVNCAKEIAEIEVYDLLIYIQKEIWLGGSRISYQRAIRLLKNCIAMLDEHHGDCYSTLNDLNDAKFSDDEIEEPGYGYLLDVDEEEDENAE